MDVPRKFYRNSIEIPLESKVILLGGLRKKPKI
jgi:hypothetical protein